uniref:Putative secreted mucin n=1 Tax=Amblyomma triste TaxID=251400 RepID=A0A023G2D4_AMBTT
MCRHIFILSAVVMCVRGVAVWAVSDQKVMCGRKDNSSSHFSRTPSTFITAKQDSPASRPLNTPSTLASPTFSPFRSLYSSLFNAIVITCMAFCSLLLLSGATRQCMCNSMSWCKELSVCCTELLWYGLLL